MSYYCSECGCDLTEGTLVELSKLEGDLKTVREGLQVAAISHKRQFSTLNTIRKERDTLRAQLATAQEDTARMVDALESGRIWYDIGSCQWRCDGYTMRDLNMALAGLDRAAIDDARKVE